MSKCLHNKTHLADIKTKTTYILLPNEAPVAQFVDLIPRFCCSFRHVEAHCHGHLNEMLNVKTALSITYEHVMYKHFTPLLFTLFCSYESFLHHSVHVRTSSRLVKKKKSYAIAFLETQVWQYLFVLSYDQPPEV